MPQYLCAGESLLCCCTNTSCNITSIGIQTPSWDWRQVLGYLLDAWQHSTYISVTAFLNCRNCAYLSRFLPCQIHWSLMRCRNVIHSMLIPFCSVVHLQFSSMQLKAQLWDICSGTAVIDSGPIANNTHSRKQMSHIPRYSWLTDSRVWQVNIWSPGIYFLDHTFTVYCKFYRFTRHTVWAYRCG